MARTPRSTKEVKPEEVQAVRRRTADAVKAEKAKAPRRAAAPKKTVANATENAQVAPPTPRPERPATPRRQDGGGFTFNWRWLILLGFIMGAAYWFFNQGNTPATPSTSNGGDTVAETQATTSSSDDLVCRAIPGFREGRKLWITETMPLQNNPDVDSSAVRQTQIVSSDILTATGESACDANENLWIQVRMIVSGGGVRTGWVQIADVQETWYVWDDSEAAPAPTATEESSASVDSDQSMRSILVGNGSCNPRLQPADFYNADETNSRGEDLNPSWSGYWVQSTVYRQDRDVIVRASATRQSTELARFGWDDEGRPESIEVIAYRNGFHYACADNLAWWNVRWHGYEDGVLTVKEGWVAETDGTSNNLMIEGFDL